MHEEFSYGCDCQKQYWKARANAEKRRNPYCFVCKAKPDNLHHLTYIHFGYELSCELVPLCRQHHIAIEKEWRNFNLREPCVFYAPEDIRDPAQVALWEHERNDPQKHRLYMLVLAMNYFKRYGYLPFRDLVELEAAYWKKEHILDEMKQSVFGMGLALWYSLDHPLEEFKCL